MHFLRMSATSAPDALIGAPLDATAARELETAHRRLLHLHLEKELKSARVLRQIR
jgi:arginine/lysine/ornithine decarboxylase